MLNLTGILISFFGVGFITALSLHSDNKMTEEGNTSDTSGYLRVSIAHWNINTYSAEAERIFQQIATDGLAVFRAQRGFINYRLMRADSTKTIAVAEWETEELGLAGAEKYRDWMRSVGIMDFIKLETYTGEIVVGQKDN
jgi:heme-degrading monooxygenase HmoA